MKTQTGLLLITLVGVFFVLEACEITQTTTPGAVDVNIQQPTAAPTDTSTGPGTADTGTINLEPRAISVEVGKNVNVKVVIKDGNGQEVPSENISVNIIDKTILSLVEIDGRIIAFEGVSAGVTSVIISASGLQTSLVATVIP